MRPGRHVAGNLLRLTVSRPACSFRALLNVKARVEITHEVQNNCQNVLRQQKFRRRAQQERKNAKSFQ
jgi:hypothetical protein